MVETTSAGASTATSQPCVTCADFLPPMWSGNFPGVQFRAPAAPGNPTVRSYRHYLLPELGVQTQPDFGRETKCRNRLTSYRRPRRYRVSPRKMNRMGNSGHSTRTHMTRSTRNSRYDLLRSRPRSNSRRFEKSEGLGRFPPRNFRNCVWVCDRSTALTPRPIGTNDSSLEPAQTWLVPFLYDTF